MSYQTLLFELRDGLALITINRPDKLNALNDEVVEELADAAERVATEPAIKGAILTGAGPKAFVAGADIGDLAQQGPFDGNDRGLEMTLDEGLLLEANHFGLLAASRDMKEGLTAFLEKRAPRFEGR